MLTIMLIIYITIMLIIYIKLPNSKEDTYLSELTNKVHLEDDS